MLLAPIIGKPYINMSKVNINVGGKKITLTTKDFDENIDVDDLLSIHYENIPGEVITIAVLLNRIGLLKAQAEGEAKKAKLNSEIAEAKLKKSLRREASINGNYFTIDGQRIKLSEKSLEESMYLDPLCQQAAEDRIIAETNHETVSVLYWSLSEKSKKLDNMIRGTKPEDFIESIIEGKINDIYISANTRIPITER
tara:strand:+ start:34208 stop:34798 length:591 start_codon:yes stop_codon:yes gene_type:complete